MDVSLFRGEAEKGTRSFFAECDGEVMVESVEKVTSTFFATAAGR